MPKLTQRAIEQLASGPNEFCLWDTEVVGLGVRIRPSGAKSFLLMYRWGGRQRKHTMGRLEVGYGLREARDRARELLRGLRDGIDPQIEKVIERSAITVAELFEAYLLDGPAVKPEKKASSWKTDQGIYECHVKPLLGKRLARDLSKLDIARFQMDVAQGKSARDIRLGHRKRSRVKGGRTVAGLSVAILGAAFQFGVDVDLVNVNPARGVKRYQVARRERYLSERELSAVSEALAELDRVNTRNVVMTDSVRMLILTGCRKNEILTLRWQSVDRHRKCLRLSESKTGPRVVPLADAAINLLDRRWRESQMTSAAAHDTRDTNGSNEQRSEFVFPAMKGTGNLVGVQKMWERVRIRANQISRQRALELGEHCEDLGSLVDVRLHDLRHSFASFAIADGASLFMVGKVLGHKQARTTEIYAHLSDDPLRSVANRTASRLAETMRL